MNQFMQTRKKIIKDAIKKILHLNDGNYSYYKIKIALFYYIRSICNLLYGKPFDNRNKKYISYVPHNSAYGHEYWLRNYSHWNKPIYGEIEHGMYFGKLAGNTAVEFPISYALKVILTYGKYREKVLKNKFKDFDIFMIGPRIAYANTDDEYKKELLEKANNERVATLFPSHSTSRENMLYDTRCFVNDAKQIAHDHGIEKIRVCLRQFDIDYDKANNYIRQGLDIVSADLPNSYETIQFLPRLKAIIETSTLMFSNDIGTQLGYGLYLCVPQIIIQQDVSYSMMNSDEVTTLSAEALEYIKIFNKEKELFAEVFNPNNGLTITKQQRELCNYYWGFDQVKTPDELYSILEKIYKKFKHR